MDETAVQATWDGYLRDRSRIDLRDALVEHYLPLSRQVRGGIGINPARLDPAAVESVANVAVWEAVEKYDPSKGRADGFVRSVLRFRIFTEMRRQYQLPAEEFLDPDQAESLPMRERSEVPEANLPRLEALLRRLGPRDRAILARFWIDGVDQGRIAAEMGITQVRVCQIWGKLKKALIESRIPREQVCGKTSMSPARAA
ncbi:MAG: sigma-70 family RNA polymerase sigma factor [Thermoguttaceae bacterium]